MNGLCAIGLSLFLLCVLAVFGCRLSVQCVAIIIYTHVHIHVVACVTCAACATVNGVVSTLDFRVYARVYKVR